jgi:hypothetical protein
MQKFLLNVRFSQGLHFLHAGGGRQPQHAQPARSAGKPGPKTMNHIEHNTKHSSLESDLAYMCSAAFYHSVGRPPSTVQDLRGYPGEEAVLVST